MKVRARSIIGKTTIGTILWIVAVVAFSGVLFLFFGDSNLTISAMSLSLIALAIRLFNFLHIGFLAPMDREVEFGDNEQTEEEPKSKSERQPEPVQKQFDAERPNPTMEGTS